MRYDTWPNLPTMFFETMKDMGDRPLFWAKRDGTWQPVSGAEAARRTAAVARYLAGIGVGPGDRVMLISENRPEWGIADMAIMSVGAIAVPAYVTNSVNDHLHVMADSGAKAAIVSTAALAERVLPAARQAPGLVSLLTMERLADGADDGFACADWDETLERYDGPADEVAADAAGFARTDTACLIYTSGTGGAPKGVMLSHGAIFCNCKGAHRLLADFGIEDEVFLSFLPLSHSYEHTVGLIFPISIGAQIYYAEGIDRLAGNMVDTRPTIMTAVPRLYETMYGRITRGVAQAGGLRAKLFAKAVALGTRKIENPGSLSLWERAVDRILDRLVRAKVQERFGGRLKALVSGGAPLNYEIGMFFSALGLRLMQGYGQTEAAPVVSCNPPGRIKIETVGPPIEGVEVRIADDSEILVRGELVMQGYWNNEEATAETIRDGWLHTGDIGTIDEDGYIRITDRKKDVIVNSGGDNIAPQRVEGFLTLQPEIAQAMVYGDRKPNLVALIIPDADFAREWARGEGREGTLADLVGDTSFRAALEAAVERVNANLSIIERIRRFVLHDEPFTVENELLTPSLKIRRHMIVAAHREALEALYTR